MNSQPRLHRRRGPAARARDTARRAAWLQQRQEKKQQGAGGPSDLSEQVSETASNVETRGTERTEMEANSVSNNRYACEHCDYTTGTEHGLNVHKGHKHKVTQMTPEKERTNAFQGDLSLSLTPSKELREEQSGNCGLEMSLDHQCEIGISDSTPQEEKEVVIEDLHCEKCNFTFRTSAHLEEHIESKHLKGPTCFASDHSAIPRLCREYPRECNLLGHKEYEEYKRIQQVKLNCKKQPKQLHCKSKM